MQKSKREKGFSLMEMIVVLAIISVLAAVLSPAIISAIGDARQGRAETDVKTIGGALMAFYKDLGQLPAKTAAGSATDIDFLVGEGDDPAIGSSGCAFNGLNVDTLLDQLQENDPGYNTSGRARWKGPYLESVKEDPWGNKYVVVINKDNLNKPAFVLSAGSDREIETDCTQSSITSFAINAGDIGFRLR